MCMFSPKIPTPPAPASFQPTQTPQDLTQGKSAKDMIKRRGLWASIFTSPTGAGAPNTTGTTGGSTGA